MSAGQSDHGETMHWYVEPDHFGARRTNVALSRRRHAEDRINSLALAITSALLFVLIAGAFMFGGRAAIAPLFNRDAVAREVNRTGAIVYAMPDGSFCRRMTFDNATAEVTSVVVERCPGALDVVGGPSPGRFNWGHGR
jgi:hypothetical protein